MAANTKRNLMLDSFGTSFVVDVCASVSIDKSYDFDIYHQILFSRFL